MTIDAENLWRAYGTRVAVHGLTLQVGAGEILGFLGPNGAGKSTTVKILTGMIKHHQGAIDMVDVLFKSYGAAQDETVFKFANDVYADQSIEIDRMTEMLEVGSRPR